MFQPLCGATSLNTLPSFRDQRAVGMKTIRMNRNKGFICNIVLTRQIESFQVFADKKLAGLFLKMLPSNRLIGLLSDLTAQSLF